MALEFVELNHFIHEPEALQEKMKKIKVFIQNWLNETRDANVEIYLRKKINEILEFHNFLNEYKF